MKVNKIKPCPVPGFDHRRQQISNAAAASPSACDESRGSFQDQMFGSLFRKCFSLHILNSNA